ncbi:MAG: hypothetical protein JRD47_10520 [Deltaproteobacteria bacterium]|nr:hypothetical protein [Deltaproteobacteria bacterium]MBW2602331.1 hypothetical protein [Deltaproteobacteria bacterium]
MHATGFAISTKFRVFITIIMMISAMPAIGYAEDTKDGNNFSKEIKIGGEKIILSPTTPGPKEPPQNITVSPVMPKPMQRDSRITPEPEPGKQETALGVIVTIPMGSKK